nr:hypothetical protein [Acinetobacter sp. Marseille-Q1620]
MKAWYLSLFLPFILSACDTDWKADLGIGCYMNGKLCFNSINYSNSSERSLVLISDNIDYTIQDKNYWTNWLTCKAINSERTICSAQQLIIPIKDHKKRCVDKIDIVKYPKDKWVLKYYLIIYKKNLNPPYMLQEMDNRALMAIKLEGWQKKQAINYEQELLCGE